MEDYLLTVFFDSSSKEQKKVIENLLQVLEQQFGQNLRTELIDIRKSSHISSTEKILVTPTIIRKKPLPQKRIIGISNDLEQIISQLRTL